MMTPILILPPNNWQQTKQRDFIGARMVLSVQYTINKSLLLKWMDGVSFVLRERGVDLEAFVQELHIDLGSGEKHNGCLEQPRAVGVL